jgi:hypothetical protein
VRSTAAPYTESRLTRSVANERVGFPVVEHSFSIPLYLSYFNFYSYTVNPFLCLVSVQQHYSF